MTEDLFQPYREFLTRLDLLIASVRDYYKESITCARGCSSCCTAGLSVFPVEALYIKTYAGDIQRKSAPGPGKCTFLENDLCLIYQLRPVVCRTQGMPLLYGTDSNEETELSLCELNFQGRNIQECISPDHIIDMDRINTILAAQNIHYLKQVNRLDDLLDKRITLDDIITGSFGPV